MLARPEELEKLSGLRLRLEEGGAAEAERMLKEVTARARQVKGEEREQVLDSDSMAKRMTRAQKLRKEQLRVAFKGGKDSARDLVGFMTHTLLYIHTMTIYIYINITIYIYMHIYTYYILLYRRTIIDIAMYDKWIVVVSP